MTVFGLFCGHCDEVPVSVCSEMTIPPVSLVPDDGVTPHCAVRRGKIAPCAGNGFRVMLYTIDIALGRTGGVMGWRVRKSIGGKLFRLNLGKHGITSATIGERGMPHVTVGKHGTYIGASIPGTGVSYSKRIDPPTTDTETRQIPIIPGNEVTPNQTMVLPANVPPSEPPQQSHQDGASGSLPWSKLVIASLIIGAVGLILAFTPAAPLGVLLAIPAFFLGIVGLIVILVKKSRRSALVASLAIILSLVSLVVGAVNTPQSQTSSTQDTADSSAEASKSAEAAASASASAEAKKKAEEEAEAKLTSAKTTLSDKIGEARTLLDESNDNVADPQTRAALTEAIDKANAVNSDSPKDYENAVIQLQQAMDVVNASEEQKKSDDEAAAKKATEDAEAAKKAAEEEAAKKAQEEAPQQQQQQQTYYPNCDAVRAAGKAPLHREDPGYRAELDRDDDGLACE